MWDDLFSGEFAKKCPYYRLFYVQQTGRFTQNIRVLLDKCEMKLWVPISLTASHISRELSSSLALYQPKHKDDNELIALQSCIYYQPITFVGFIVI